MDVVLFSLAVVVLAAFVAAPLYRRGAPRDMAPGGRGSAREQALLGALDDLEVDRASGLVDDGSYAAEKAALQAQLDAAD